MKKRIMALLLCGVMACSCMACSPKSEDNNQADVSGSSSNADDSAANDECEYTFICHQSWEDMDDEVGYITLLGYEEKESYYGTDLSEYTGPTGRVIEIPATVDGAPVVEVGGFNADCSITKVIIPEGVKVIRQEAFSFCRNLEEVVIPDGVEEIGGEAFQFSNIYDITIPASVTYIGYYCFQESHEITVHGEAGSYVETYCQENDINFEAL